jgi:hypothetical protein
MNKTQNTAMEQNSIFGELLSADFDVLLHTLGLSDPFQERSYRNYFVAGPGHDDIPSIKRLCAAGLMAETRQPKFLEKRDKVFSATNAGLDYAKKHRKRPTRGQIRYHKFLEVSDVVSDLTFHEFLTNPEFAAMR